MKTYARLLDVPASALLAQVQPDGTVLAYFDGDQLPPSPPQAPPAPTRFVTAQEYRQRFTNPELLALLSSTDAGVKLLVLKVSTAPPEGIDLLSPTVSAGLAYLVAQGVLAADRPAQIAA